MDALARIAAESFHRMIDERYDEFEKSAIQFDERYAIYNEMRPEAFLTEEEFAKKYPQVFTLTDEEFDQIYPDLFSEENDEDEDEDEEEEEAPQTQLGKRSESREVVDLSLEEEDDDVPPLKKQNESK